MSLAANDETTPPRTYIMGTQTMKPRCVRYTVRLTEQEDVELHRMMANLDYLSVAKYFRERALDRQTDIRRNIVLTDRNLRNQINNLASDVAKIGVDYNQATKKFNSLVKMKRSDGSPVLNERAANYYLTRLQKMTLAIKDRLDKIIEIVSRLDYDNVPHGGGQQ